MRTIMLLMLAIMAVFGAYAADEAVKENKADIDYSVVCLMVEGKGTSETIERFVAKIGAECRGNNVRGASALSFKIVSDKDEADPNAYGLYCRLRIDNVRTAKKKVSLDKGWYQEIETEIATGSYQTMISEDGKWNKLSKGKVTYNQSSPILAQTTWIVWGSALDVKIKKEKKAEGEVELSGQIRNNLPFAVANVCLLAPFTVELPEISANPIKAVDKIAAGGKENFSITVPHFVSKTFQTPKGDGAIKTYFIWKNAFAASAEEMLKTGDNGK